MTCVFLLLNEKCWKEKKHSWALQCWLHKWKMTGLTMQKLKIIVNFDLKLLKNIVSLVFMLNSDQHCIFDFLLPFLISRNSLCCFLFLTLLIFYLTKDARVKSKNSQNFQSRSQPKPFRFAYFIQFYPFLIIFVFGLTN